MSDGKSVLGGGEYSLSGEKSVLQIGAWEEELRRRFQQQEEGKREAALAEKQQRLAKVREAIRLEEEERRRREKAEEEAVGADGQVRTVPAELVKEEADAILAEAQEKLAEAVHQRDQAVEVLREARQAAEKLSEEMRLETQEKAKQAEAEARGRGESEGREAGHREGYQKGLDEGKAAGLAQGLGELGELKKTYQGLLKDLAARADAAIGARAEKVNEVVMGIARRVVASELELRPGLVVDVIKEALAKVRDRNKVVVHLNPEDIQAGRRHRHELLAQLDGVANLQLVEDGAVGRGGCLIETGSSLVDARIESKLAEIAGELELPDAPGGEAATESVAPAPGEQKKIEELRSKVEDIESAGGQDSGTASEPVADEAKRKEEQELRDMFADFEAPAGGDEE